jgi:putative ABC transport system permease protein
VFGVQRFVSEYKAEPLMGVLPGVALDELWSVLEAGERALLAVSALVAAVSLAGLVATILAGLNERRRELAILRSLGAGPRHVLLLLAIEGGAIVLAGVALGVAVLAGVIAGLAPAIQTQYGVALTAAPPDAAQLGLLGAVILAGVLASLIPAYRAYRLALADGLTPRI